MTEARENCGLVGLISPDDDANRRIWLGLLALQHRGQEAAGIYTFDGSRFYHKKQLGLLGNSEDFDDLEGNCGIGHVRYSTVGPPATADTYADPQKIEEFAQPYFSDRPKSGISLCHNGNIVNFPQLCNEIRATGTFVSQSTCDAEVILKMLANQLTKEDTLEKAVRQCMLIFEGAYSVVALTGDGELIAFRDPNGFRPLCYGQSDGLTIFASESVALDINGVHNYSNVQPGELIIAKENEPLVKKQLIERDHHARCMFEYVYFSRPDSTIDGRDVYTARIKLGRNLARTYKTHADVIVPVPDTARPAADGISRETGIPVQEGLIKNRYVGRTFIMPVQKNRDNAVRLKLNVVKAVVKGKNVLLVDDSIVRGTTMKKIINLLKEAGAKRVEVWITSPPIKSPCFYGIDMPSHSELIASNKEPDKIRSIIGADALCYQTINGLVDAIGLPKQETCLSCLTGEYPTPLAQKLVNEMLTKPQTPGQARYWETHQ